MKERFSLEGSRIVVSVNRLAAIVILQRRILLFCIILIISSSNKMVAISALIPRIGTTKKVTTMIPVRIRKTNININPRRNSLYSFIGPTEGSIDSMCSSPSQELLLLKKKQEELHQSSKLSLAPMMDYTTRHFRYLFRLLSKHTLLYTEMVAANALCRCYDTNEEGEEDEYAIRRYLAQPANIGPSVIQLGGSDPNQLYQACQIISSDTTSSYTAINLNCGCPSPKVANKGCFGAALMDQPLLVRDLCTAMWEGSQRSFPITVKCRIGTQDTPYYNSKGGDDKDWYPQLAHFIDTVSSEGIVTDFQIHARIALLHPKVSPSQNRQIPPLQYDIVHRLVQDFPHLTFSLNGGIETLSQVQDQYQTCPKLHGIMVGRSMVAHPWHWSMADTLIYDTNNNNNLNSHCTTSTETTITNRWEVLRNYGSYADIEEQNYGLKVRPFLLKAIHGLFTGEPNAKYFRIALNTIAQEKNTNIPISEQILKAAEQCFTENVLFRAKGEESLDQRKHLLTNNTPQQQRSLAVQEWQQIRKEDENNLYRT